ncbi:hypothetical protein D9758_013985 [Tetrapyrgos nigripes]|uniref:DDE Tnp4 domain-containing protein n=1 Tax=Tetrapyrgos nigripes TaxID=182062 RepID=A0A8H5G7Z8_9AGAR|nr:hypothetical protein D9758_013985 [Tetrapyrgos nigripes]
MTMALESAQQVDSATMQMFMANPQFMNMLWSQLQSMQQQNQSTQSGLMSSFAAVGANNPHDNFSSDSECIQETPATSNNNNDQTCLHSLSGDTQTTNDDGGLEPEPMSDIRSDVALPQVASRSVAIPNATPARQRPLRRVNANGLKPTPARPSFREPTEKENEVSSPGSLKLTLTDGVSLPLQDDAPDDTVEVVAESDNTEPKTKKVKVKDAMKLLTTACQNVVEIANICFRHLMMQRTLWLKDKTEQADAMALDAWKLAVKFLIENCEYQDEPLPTLTELNIRGGSKFDNPGSVLQLVPETRNDTNRRSNFDRQFSATKRLYKHATPASNTSTVSTSSDSDTTTTSSASTSQNSLISQSSSEASSTSSSPGSDNRGSESDSDYVGSDFFQQVLEDVELDIIVREVSLMASSAALEVELTVGFDSESGMMGSDADDEESEEEDMDLDDWDMDMATGGARSDRNRTRQVWLCVQQELSAMYAHRYTIPCKIHVKAPPQLPFILTHSKLHQLKDFRQCLRVSPYTFDHLVERIQNDTIFTNHSSNGQMPVADQLAIALYRFGHYGNAAGLDAVRRWAGIGKGTVVLVTKRILAALLQSDMLAENLCMPTEEEREEAKAWVERCSCPAWRNGWCLVDGTLVPLFNRPYWYSESYFDRKCNYSLNFQIISLPNLCIINVGYGYTGSTHDATAWEMTRIKQLIATLIRCGEWVWADSAYPVHPLL